MSFMKAYFGVMDPNNLLCMAKKWQQADITRNRGELKDVLAQINAKVFVLSIDEDMMFPCHDCEAEHQYIPNSEHRVIHSSDGHLALFGTDQNYLEQVDAHLKELLQS